MNVRWHLLNDLCSGKINIFFAGSGFNYDLAYSVGVRKRLLSWHANSLDELVEYQEKQKTEAQSFGILDSGAFTIWNKGGSIDPEQYAKKIVELADSFDIFASLDVIPGKKGMSARDITPAITEAAAVAGWKNYETICEILKANGIDRSRLMNIYHQGESMDWLKRMADTMPYFGVSPSNDYATPQRQLWLDDVFDYLLSLPKLPMTHGYAVTSPVLMTQYPWMSVDSSSWIQQGGYGTVNTPYGIITLTDREHIMGKADAMGGRGWSREMKDKVYAYFNSIGIDIEEAKKDFRKRWQANAIYLLEWEKKMQYKPRQKPKGLFETTPELKINRVVVTPTQDAFGLTIDGKPPLGERVMHLYGNALRE